MPEKLKELLVTDEEVTSENWREIQPGDYAWYVPENAKTVDDGNMVLIGNPGPGIKTPEGFLVVHVIENSPGFTVSRGRLSLVELKPEPEREIN